MGIEDLPLITAVRRHSVFGHMSTLTVPCNSSLTLPVASLLHQIGDAHPADHVECGGAPGATLRLQLGSQLWIGQCRDHYDPQLVMRNSECVRCEIGVIMNQSESHFCNNGKVFIMLPLVNNS